LKSFLSSFNFQDGFIPRIEPCFWSGEMYKD
jgi:hypothetical protein